MTAGAALACLLPFAAACSATDSGGSAARSGAAGTAQFGGGFPGAGGLPGAGGATAPPPGNGGAPGGAATGASGGGSGKPQAFSDAGLVKYSYDPGVTFTWPEGNVDGGAPRCKAGHYVGTYSCNVTYGDAGSFNYALTGPVDLKLAQGQSGEFLTISGGTLASAAGILTLNASLLGDLSCTTGAFAGTLQNGKLSIFPLPPGGTFSGSLEAGFVESGPKLVGTWTLIGEGAFKGYVCHGPWTATWQPN